MAVVNRVLRQQVINTYKGFSLPKASGIYRAVSADPQYSFPTIELLHMGRSYPLGYGHFRSRLHKAFARNANLCDEQDIREALERAAFVRKGDTLWLAATVRR